MQLSVARSRSTEWIEPERLQEYLQGFRGLDAARGPGRPRRVTGAVPATSPLGEIFARGKLTRVQIQLFLSSCFRDVAHEVGCSSLLEAAAAIDNPGDLPDAFYDLLRAASQNRLAIGLVWAHAVYVLQRPKTTTAKTLGRKSQDVQGWWLSLGLPEVTRLINSRSYELAPEYVTALESPCQSRRSKVLELFGNGGAKVFNHVEVESAAALISEGISHSLIDIPVATSQLVRGGRVPQSLPFAGSDFEYGAELQSVDKLPADIYSRIRYKLHSDVRGYARLDVRFSLPHPPDSVTYNYWVVCRAFEGVGPHSAFLSAAHGTISGPVELIVRARQGYLFEEAPRFDWSRSTDPADFHPSPSLSIIRRHVQHGQFVEFAVSLPSLNGTLRVRWLRRKEEQDRQPRH